MESLLLLPNPSNLSPNLLLFLDQHFKTHEDLPLIPSLLKKLMKDCGDLDWNLLSLKKNLSSTIASWISRSDAVDSVLQQLSLKLEDFDPSPFRGLLIISCLFLWYWVWCLFFFFFLWKIQFFWVFDQWIWWVWMHFGWNGGNGFWVHGLRIWVLGFGSFLLMYCEMLKWGRLFRRFLSEFTP